MNYTDYSNFPRGKWTVSKKFHDEVIDRFSTVAALVVKSCDFYRTLLALYRCYLNNHYIPDGFTDDLMAMAVFETMRPEIDRAVVRSHKARKNALERRRRKDSASDCASLSPVTEDFNAAIDDRHREYPTGYIFYLETNRCGDDDEHYPPMPLKLDISPHLARC